VFSVVSGKPAAVNQAIEVDTSAKTEEDKAVVDTAEAHLQTF
jgi:hypothetical protein